MPPVSPERFAALFRSLGSTARTRFVADLWRARGWETAVRDTFVVATRDGDERRIRVVDPGGFGVPKLGNADVVVTVRDTEAVRERASAAAVTYLPPDAVRDRLLYGLEREKATALFAETFDQPLTATPATRNSFVRVRDAATERWAKARERASGTRQLALLVVLALVVGTVVVAPAVSPAKQASTTAHSVTYTPGDAGALGESPETSTAATAADDGARPAGLGKSSITDLDRLLDGHVDAVVRTPRTLRVSASGPANATFMRGRKAWNYTVRIESPRVFRYDGRFVLESSMAAAANRSDAAVLEVSTYADGESEYRREEDANGTSYRRYRIETVGDASGYAVGVRGYLETFLRGARSIVDCVGTLESGDCFAYRIVVTGAPPTIEDAEAYRATAVVQDDGVVSSLQVSYTLPDADGDGAREPVRFAFEYGSFGETTVTEPDWLSEATNETSG